MTDYNTCCKVLIKRCIQLLNNFDCQKPLINQVQRLKIPSLIASIPFQYKEVQPKQVGLRTLISDQQFRISVYHLPQNMILKMHNHPDMMVVTYILRGNLISRSMTPIGSDYYSQKLFDLKRKDIITIDSHDNSFHEFKGGKNGATFLDIMFPDYNDKQRIFKTYQILEEGNSLFRLKQIEYEDIPFTDL